MELTKEPQGKGVSSRPSRPHAALLTSLRAIAHLSIGTRECVGAMTAFVAGDASESADEEEADEENVLSPARRTSSSPRKYPSASPREG